MVRASPHGQAIGRVKGERKAIWRWRCGCAGARHQNDTLASDRTHAPSATLEDGMRITGTKAAGAR